MDMVFVDAMESVLVIKDGEDLIAVAKLARVNLFLAQDMVLANVMETVLVIKDGPTHTLNEKFVIVHFNVQETVLVMVSVYVVSVIVNLTERFFLIAPASVDALLLVELINFVTVLDYVTASLDYLVQIVLNSMLASLTTAKIVLLIVIAVGVMVSQFVKTRTNLTSASMTLQRIREDSNYSLNQKNAPPKPLPMLINFQRIRLRS